MVDLWKVWYDQLDKHACLSLRMTTNLQGLALGVWYKLGIWHACMYILLQCCDGFGLSGEGCGHRDDGGSLGWRLEEEADHKGRMWAFILISLNSFHGEQTVATRSYNDGIVRSKIRNNEKQEIFWNTLESLCETNPELASHRMRYICVALQRKSSDEGELSTAGWKSKADAKAENDNNCDLVYLTISTFYISSSDIDISNMTMWFGVFDNVNFLYFIS